MISEGFTSFWSAEFSLKTSAEVSHTPISIAKTIINKDEVGVVGIQGHRLAMKDHVGCTVVGIHFTLGTDKHGSRHSFYPGYKYGSRHSFYPGYRQTW